jgi:hypothetical protein
MTADSYTTTRRSLHTVAEHVLAAALHRATGRIGLRATPGGFGTPPFTVDGVERRLRIDGVDLVVADNGLERRAPLRTVGEAARFAGIEPGAPADVYPPATLLDPDAPLALDPAEATRIHRWFAQADAALAELRRSHAALEPSIAQLWPEHLDLAISMAEVNYGASPGDDRHAAPYAYVGPWATDDLDGDYWNESFGASRTAHELGSVADLVAFLQTGCTLISHHR